MGVRVVFLALLLLLAGAVGHHLGQSRPDPSAQDTTTVHRPLPNVIVAVQELARLEGAQFHLERVIDLREKQSRLFGLLQGEDTILLVAGGNVIAGVDLSTMQEQDVSVDFESRRATIVLPRATVFSATLDNELTYVHERSTDILATPAADLETKARREAERQLRQAALEGGILSAAERSVARTVLILVRSLGYEDVRVTFAPAADRSATPEHADTD